MTFYLSKVLKTNLPQIAAEVPLKKIPVKYWTSVTSVKSVAKNQFEILAKQLTPTVSKKILTLPQLDEILVSCFMTRPLTSFLLKHLL